MNPQLNALRHAFVLFAVLLGLADAILSGIFGLGYAKLRAVETRGVDATATVVEQYWRSTRTFRRRYRAAYIRYAYVAPDQSSAVGVSRVSNEDAARLQPGMTIPITYDPQAPQSSEANLDGKIHSRDSRPFLIMIAIMNGGFALFGWLLFSVWKRIGVGGSSQQTEDVVAAE